MGGGVQDILLGRGDKPEKGGGVATFLLVYSSVTFTVCGEVLFITFRIFSILSEPFKILIHFFYVLKPGIICIFLIHSGSLQKMLTALT